MRIWLSRNGGTTLRDQLTTQLVLAILSGDLKPGEKLPSVRELAQRHGIHPNTASAAFRELEARQWVTSKKGSGVYVKAMPGSDENRPSGLDILVEAFFTETRARGFSTADVRARLIHWLDHGPVRRVVVVEPEPELCQILIAELRQRVALPVTGLSTHDVVLSRELLKDAAVVALSSRMHHLLPAVPAGIPHLLLHLRSLSEHLRGQQAPPPGMLIAVASSSPEILRHARTALNAAGLDAAGIGFYDAREKGWLNGIRACHFVAADVVTAPRIPSGCVVRPIRMLSDSSLEELQSFLRTVTEQEVSC